MSCDIINLSQVLMLNRLYSNMAIMLKSTKTETLQGGVVDVIRGPGNFLRGKFLCLNQRVFYHTFIRWLKHLFGAYVIHMKHHKGSFDRPVIIVANHTSRWDPFFILSCAPKDFVLKQLAWRFPTMHTFFVKIKYVHFKYFLLWIGAYPIKPKGDLNKSLEKTISILRKKQNVIFFPEGKLAKKNEKLRPKKGISHLIERSRVYVLPVYVSYSKRGKNGKGARIGRACVVFGEAIKSEYFIQKYDKEERHEQVMKHVYKLSDMKDKYYPHNKANDQSEDSNITS